MSHVSAEYNGGYLTPDQIEVLHTGLEADLDELAAMDAEPDPEAHPEAGLGHEYDGPELHPGTPEYEAEYAEYQVWAGQAEPEPEAEL